MGTDRQTKPTVHPFGIIAALPKSSEVWDPLKLLHEAEASTHKRWIYKRCNELSTVRQRIEEDDRFKEGLRILVVTYPTLMNSIDPNSGSTTSAPPMLTEIREKFEWKLHQLVVIGISTNNMFGDLLQRMGCDAACTPEALHRLILDIIQPGSRRIKLPD